MSCSVQMTSSKLTHEFLPFAMTGIVILWQLADRTMSDETDLIAQSGAGWVVVLGGAPSNNFVDFQTDNIQ